MATQKLSKTIVLFSWTVRYTCLSGHRAGGFLKNIPRLWTGAAHASENERKKKERERYRTLNLKILPDPSANERTGRGRFRKMT